MTKTSFTYNNNPVYRVQLFNIKNNVKKQKHGGEGNDEFNVFELTASLAFMMNMPKEVVMNDYLNQE